MNLEAFVRTRRASWDELNALLARAHGRPERLGPEGVLRLGALYRAVVADLSRLRRVAPGDPLTRRLEELVARARGTVYAVARPERSARDYLRRGYWQAVRARAGIIGLAWLLLVGAAALAAVWALHDPGAAAGVVPGTLAGGGGGPHRAIGLGAGQAAALSISIFTNNIGVTFTTFASGVLLGLGPAFFLIYNGVILGAVVGIASANGHWADVVELIAPHGLLELSCIVVCAAAGARMGWHVVEPGDRGRLQALSAAAPGAVVLVIATAPWLILAGLVEGFVTPHHLPLAPALVIGIALAALYWCAVAWLGREERLTRAAQAVSRRLALT